MGYEVFRDRWGRETVLRHDWFMTEQSNSSSNTSRSRKSLSPAGKQIVGGAVLGMCALAVKLWGDREVPAPPTGGLAITDEDGKPRFHRPPTR